MTGPGEQSHEDMHRAYFGEVLDSVRKVMGQNYGLKDVSIRPIRTGGSRLSIPVRITGNGRDGRKARYFGKILGNSDITVAASIQFFKNVYLQMNAQDPIFEASRSAEDMAKDQYEALKAIHGLGIPTAHPFGYHRLEGNLWLVVADFLEAKPMAETGNVTPEQISIVFGYLKKMHRNGLFHGDLKPENIMVGEKIFMLDVGRFRHGDAPGAPRHSHAGAVCVQQVAGDDLHHAVMRILDHVDDEGQAHGAGDLFHAAPAGRVHPAERDLGQQGRRHMRGRGGGEAAHAGLDDLGPAGVAGPAVRDDVAQADEQVGVHRRAVHLHGDGVVAGADLAEVDERLVDAVVVLGDAHAAVRLLPHLGADLLVGHDAMRARCGEDLDVLVAHAGLVEGVEQHREDARHRRGARGVLHQHDHLLLAGRQLAQWRRADRRLEPRSQRRGEVLNLRQGLHRAGEDDAVRRHLGGDARLAVRQLDARALAGAHLRPRRPPRTSPR